MKELESIAEHICRGASIIEAYEAADLDALRKEGNREIADDIETVLRLVIKNNGKMGID